VLEPESRDLFEAMASRGFLERDLLDPQQSIERLSLALRREGTLRHSQLGFAMWWSIRGRRCAAGAGTVCAAGSRAAGCAVSTAAGATRVTRFVPSCLLAL
jgi:hypothetical protein